MQKRHINRDSYFKEQSITTQKFVIPYINEVMEINQNTSVLEIGCGEGGNLAPFQKLGCKRIVGIDLNEAKINKGKELFEKIDKEHNVEFIIQNIYDADPTVFGQFDLIITRDVLEHIHDQEKFLHFVKKFMKPKGKFFLGFPPWYNPFGGHQQICINKFLSKIPYFHILPRSLYTLILKTFNEPKRVIDSLLEIKETGITIERFERIANKENYKFDKKTFYFINPNYETKFGLKPRKIWNIIGIIPFVRNFFITVDYSIISKK